MSDNILQFPIATRLMADMREALRVGNKDEIMRIYYEMFPSEKPAELSLGWQIIFEVSDDWENHPPCWVFSIFFGEEREGVGSADDLTTAMSMAEELFESIRSGKVRKGVKQRTPNPPTGVVDKP